MHTLLEKRAEKITGIRSLEHCEDSQRRRLLHTPKHWWLLVGGMGETTAWAGYAETKDWPEVVVIIGVCDICGKKLRQWYGIKTVDGREVTGPINALTLGEYKRWRRGIMKTNIKRQSAGQTTFITSELGFPWRTLDNKSIYQS